MKPVQLIALAGCVLCLMLAAAHIDAQDAMDKCQKRYSFAACHQAVYGK